MRITVLLAVNADGIDMLKPYVMGRAVKPRCFKNIKTLPTKYAANKKSWVTSSLFTDFLTSLDWSMKIQKRKILLFIDQCPARPPICNLKNVRVLPCKLYKCASACKVFCFCKSLDALYFVRQSWDQVSKNTIEKYFQKAGFPCTQVESDEKVIFPFDPSEEVMWKEVAPGIDFNDYVTCDNGLSIYATKVNDIVDLSVGWLFRVFLTQEPVLAILRHC
ncbi:Tigger transposable element-derived protein 4 [Araneus ventricosus]|uniref:Tigger transposable element-derived protein 4 n=1 Tax=Araneus ventricosus TaxID=182803 RepID=A0A4Y2S4D0_ARAVE|nr:Tigger transposable element-derived protein 4 [Araneus ventricosus]